MYLFSCSWVLSWKSRFSEVDLTVWGALRSRDTDMENTVLLSSCQQLTGNSGSHTHTLTFSCRSPKAFWWIVLLHCKKKKKKQMVKWTQVSESSSQSHLRQNSHLKSVGDKEGAGLSSNLVKTPLRRKKKSVMLWKNIIPNKCEILIIKQVRTHLSAESKSFKLWGVLNFCCISLSLSNLRILEWKPTSCFSIKHEWKPVTIIKNLKQVFHRALSALFSLFSKLKELKFNPWTSWRSSGLEWRTSERILW